MAKYVLIDTETTGNKDSDRIIQIAGMVMDENRNVETFKDYCSTDVKIGFDAMEVNNITPEKIKGKPSCNETKMFKQLEKYNNKENYLIIHNAQFDLKMLEKEGFVSKYKLIDTFKCAKKLYPKLERHRLQYLRYALGLYKIEEQRSKEFNIPIVPNDALSDVLMMKILLNNLEGKVPSSITQNSMDELVKLSKDNIMVNKIPFGKYKGQRITDIVKKDKSYLIWILGNMEELDEDLKYTIKKYLGYVK